MPDLEKEELIKQFWENWSKGIDGCTPHEAHYFYMTERLMLLDNDLLEIMVNNQYEYTGGIPWKFNEWKFRNYSDSDFGKVSDSDFGN